ncbi:hypothetical protein [Anaerotignum sp.]|uniref:hypothetical protein n=1 Tax=Anaerotignum sp. TaxID=2039241 RepID=UPI00289E97CF|nr:hypothetical protein [Anaerotignum sp.]
MGFPGTILNFCKNNKEDFYLKIVKGQIEEKIVVMWSEIMPKQVLEIVEPI